MNKVWMMSVAVLGLGYGVATTVSAGSACCSSGDKAPKVEAKAKVMPANCAIDASAFDKLNLTAEQKTKVDALKASCATADYSVAARKEMAKGMKEILTPEQFTQFKALCDDAGCAPTSKKKG